MSKSREWRRANVEAGRREAKQFEARIEALGAEYGYRLAYVDAARIRALRVDASSPLPLIPCRARLRDGTIVDPCLLLMTNDSALRWSFARRFPSVYVGGQIADVEPSDYTLPPAIRKAARDTLEYRMGSYEPLLVSIAGESKYLVSAFSDFFECGEWKGKDIDPAFWANPEMDEHRKGRYLWGDSLEGRTGVVMVKD